MDELAVLARRFRFNERLLAAETAGFEPADGAQPPAPSGGNTAHWILGHVFRASSERFEALSAALAPADARSISGARAFPDGSRSVADVLHFLYFHETYHLGRLGLIRRLRGKPGFA